MHSEVYAKNLFSFEEVDRLNDVSCHLYSGCTLLKNISYVKQDEPLRAGALSDYEFVTMLKGTKWDQITYSVKKGTYFLDRPKEGIHEVFLIEEWFKTNLRDTT